MMNRFTQLLIAACCIASSTALTVANVSFAFEKADSCIGMDTPIEEKLYVKNVMIPLTVDLAEDEYFFIGAKKYHRNGNARHLYQEEFENRIEQWLEDNNEEELVNRHLQWDDPCDDEDLWYLFSWCTGPPNGGRALAERKLSGKWTDKIPDMGKFDNLQILHVNSVCERVVQYLGATRDFECIIVDPPFCNFAVTNEDV